MTTAVRRSGARLWARRIGWLVTIWILSVGALALASLALKAVMRLAGMST
jgi:hypothetical protein